MSARSVTQGSVAVAAIALFVSCSRSALAVEGGVEDRTTTHAVAISRGSPSNPRVVCTGTLVATRVVLTARHCLLGNAAPASACDDELGAIDDAIVRDSWVSASPYAEPSRGWHRVSRAVVPETAEVCGDDVALLVLEDSILPAEATPARPITAAAERDVALRAGVIGLAGFGATSIEMTDIGLRRSRFDVPVQCVPGTEERACSGALAYVGTREFSAGAGPCRGDSGAGAIVASDRQVIAGVLARGNLARSCSEGIFVRTDAWAWLIARAVLDAKEPSPPAWATDLFPAAPRRGQFCDGVDSCADGAACVSLDERRSFTCLERCPSGACADGYVCDRELCVPRPAAVTVEDEGGCRASSKSHVWDPFALVMVASLLALFYGRRRG